MRQNMNGTLFTLVYDRLAALHLDPVEKKPLFHFLPGTQTLSIATSGCNLSCSFCQNSDLSQAPKRFGRIIGEKMTPADLVGSALNHGAESISFTYSEPTIFFELMEDTAILAKQKGLKTILVSNGFQSPECLERLKNLIDAANIDIKAFSEDFYTTHCGAKLQPVLNNLKTIKQMGWWLEITTLVIPGLNDSPQEFENIAGFISCELGPGTPWHISRFHPCFEMTNRPSTPVTTLETAWRIGIKMGLSFVYVGNVFGHATEDTQCPSCHHPVIKRRGFSILDMDINNFACAECGIPIPGVWRKEKA